MASVAGKFDKELGIVKKTMAVALNEHLLLMPTKSMITSRQLDINWHFTIFLSFLFIHYLFFAVESQKQYLNLTISKQTGFYLENRVGYYNNLTKIMKLKDKKSPIFNN